MSGTLYLCATPIGNLEDITLRVLRTLQEVDVIAAEDTRNTIKLLNHFEIKTPMTSYHEYNKVDKAAYLVEQLANGKNIALVTDAGTPAISDPGTSLPGACACVTALTLSGLSTRRFAFEAFLPSDKKLRRKILDSLCTETRTVIIYEAPHHLRATLQELFAALGDRRLTICRELTKIHESAMQFTLSEAIYYYEQNAPKGEYVLVIEGRNMADLEQESRDAWAQLSVNEHMQHYLSEGMDRKDAMKQVAKDRGVPKREIYQQLLNKDT